MKYDVENGKTRISGGVGFTELLTVVFITLKLCGTIDWSWWWVLSPIWIPILFALLCIAIIAFCGDK